MLKINLFYQLIFKMNSEILFTVTIKCPHINCTIEVKVFTYLQYACLSVVIERV